MMTEQFVWKILTKLVFAMIGPVEIDSKQEINSRRLVMKNALIEAKKNKATFCE